MATLSIDAKQALQFSTRRHIVALFKEMLTLLEHLAEEHDEALSKLVTALPADYHTHVGLADHFTEEKADRLRRLVLQRGNDCARAVQEEIERYHVDFTR